MKSAAAEKISQLAEAVNGLAKEFQTDASHSTRAELPAWSYDGDYRGRYDDQLTQRFGSGFAVERECQKSANMVTLFVATADGKSKIVKFPSTQKGKAIPSPAGPASGLKNESTLEATINNSVASAMKSIDWNKPVATTAPAPAPSAPVLTIEQRIAALHSEGKFEDAYALLPANHADRRDFTAKSYAAFHRASANRQVRYIPHNTGASEGEKDMRSLAIDTSTKSGFKEWCEGTWGASAAIRNEFGGIFTAYTAYVWNSRTATAYRAVWGGTLSQAMAQ